MDKQKNTVVIVGAGPVGLWIACQLKLLNKNLVVIVFEKRTEYVREHILKLKIEHMKTPYINNNEFENLKKKINGKTPTKLLESELQQFAQNLGVTIIKGQSISTFQDVYKHVPEQNIIALLGCDGRRSAVRSLLMKKYKNGDKLNAFSKLWLPIMYPLNLRNRIWSYDILHKKPKIDEEQNMIEEEVFLHQLMLKYSIQGVGKSLSKLDYFQTLQILKLPATEIVGKYIQSENKTEATCIFLLDKQTANDVQIFTPQNPGKFNQLNEKVKESVNVWMNTKEEKVKQNIIVNSERLVYVPISVYCACDFIDLNTALPIALVGDSAYGVPYFKALNTSLESGTKIVELLTDIVQKNAKIKDKFQEYQSYMAKKVYDLFSDSSLKSHQYQIGMNIFQMNSKIQWQFIKWTNGNYKKKLFKNFDPNYEENEEYQNIKHGNQKPEEWGMLADEVEDDNQNQQQQQ